MPGMLLVAVTALLAFANGANDNYKGVATLWGGGLLSYRRALVWATASVTLGGLAALLGSGRLVAAFSGAGIVSPDVAGTGAFLSAVGAGAATAVLLAGRIGLPVSTTHALFGALVGAGLASAAGTVRGEVIGRTFVLPLLFSPLAAAAGAGLLARRGHGRALGAAWLRPLHLASAGLVGFARGLNDAPKLAALAVAGTGLALEQALLLVAGGMALGGLVGARRVARTLSHGITPLPEAPAFLANAVTSGLVLSASLTGLPVSTTHVSTGALIGVGTARRSTRWFTVRTILLAWVVTLPLSGLVAALAYHLLLPALAPGGAP